jgi:hypothetical protein
MNYLHVLRTTNDNNFNDYHCSEYDSSWFYGYFGNNYGLAFFINERKEQYARLNKYVFSPLSIIHQETQGSGNEAYFFSNLLFRIRPPTLSSIIDSVYFKHALKHMEIHAEEHNE